MLGGPQRYRRPSLRHCSGLALFLSCLALPRYAPPPSPRISSDRCDFDMLYPFNSRSFLCLSSCIPCRGLDLSINHALHCLVLSHPAALAYGIPAVYHSFQSDSHRHPYILCPPLMSRREWWFNDYGSCMAGRGLSSSVQFDPSFAVRISSLLTKS